MKKKQPLSSCCGVIIEIYSDPDGTSFYYCSLCEQPVNPDGKNPLGYKLIKPKKKKEINEEALGGLMSEKQYHELSEIADGVLGKKEQPEWEEALNKILWSNLALKEEHARPMKRELQDDLKAFIRKVEQEAYERGRDDGYDKGFDKGVEYSEEIKKQERAEFKKELMGKFQFLPIWTISKKAIIKIIKEA